MSSDFIEKPDINDLVADAKPHPRRNAIIAWGGAILVLAGVVWLLLARHGADATRYQTAAIVRGDVTAKVTATGVLRPVKQVEVGSEISGVIESIDVDYNDRVKQGQVLARLNTDQLTAMVSQAQAALGSAEAGLNQTKTTVVESERRFQRCETLARTQMCSQQDLDQVQAIYQRAQAAELAAAATVSQASANLESARTALGKAAIVAPIDGIVLNRYVEPGQTVAATFQTPVLFTIAEDLTQMQLKADIDEADIGRVTLGQAAHFTVDAYPAREFAAAVVAVRFAPKTVDGVVTYEAVLDVNNAEMLLRPGMTATVDIVTETRHDVWLIPNAALRFRPPPALAATRPPDQPNPNARTIWILAPGQRQPQPVHIAIGAADDRNTELRSDPLPDGTQVVVDVLQDNAAAQRGADGGS